MRSGPNQALLERISFLEAQLAAYAESPPPAKVDPSPFGTPHAVSPTSSEDEKKKNNIADIVGFLSLGGDGAYVGSSSGFSLATNLGQMVQATVWNKALASTVSQSQPKAMTIADLYANFLRLSYPDLDNLQDSLSFLNASGGLRQCKTGSES
jgi:hypothetical protein